MTATLHKVLAGNGYLYYLRHVAADDATDRGPGSLADYYSARGESPGRWHGAGLAALGLTEGQQVTEQQMKALFGEGRHPDADLIDERIITTEIARGAKPKDAQRAADHATRLGNPYRVYDNDNEFRNNCADAFAEHNAAHGVHRTSAIPDDIRARIRTRVATSMFTDAIGRAPLDARELSGWVARNSRPQSAAVAGFDITFSPVKSVSALWAIAPKAVSEKVAAAHEATVDDAISWLEKHGVFTRLGRNGVRQVDVEGLVAARFTHRESRCGDPDLHTHMLIANRVRTLDGRWRTLDATVIYRLVVTVSEIYNSRLEQHLEADLGLSFSERAGTDPTKRPIREITGMPSSLVEFWSRRDSAITAQLGELTAAFQHSLRREPMPKELFALMERATLETRPAKHRSRTRAQQRADWRAQAESVLGGRKAMADTTSAIISQRSPPPRGRIGAEGIARIAQQVLATVSAQRPTWQWHHVRAEAERRLRGRLPRDHWAATVDAVISEALSRSYTVARGDPDLTAEPVLRETPTIYQRVDGASMYTRVDLRQYTSVLRLDVTERLIELSLKFGARTIPEHVVAATIRDYNSNPANRGRQLNAGQTSVVTEFAQSPWHIATTNAPAGTGKTTAMRVLADAWRTDGGTVLGLAPTAAAAAVLGEATGARVETVDKLLTTLRDHSPTTATFTDGDRPFPATLPQWVLQIDTRTLVIVDEHMRLGDDKRLQLFEFLLSRGAAVRCVGDDHQLPPIEAGGGAADTADAARASTLTHVVRFVLPAEASTSLLIREGDSCALGFYLDHQRVHSGSPTAVREQGYAGWIADHLAGRDTIMLAATHEAVSQLNAQARADRLARTKAPPGWETRLADELFASVGDIICTRHNDPRLRLGERDWVRNGYRWTVTDVHPDGALTVTHLRPGRHSGDSTVLPASYVRHHVRLGYAMTIDSAQGITADTCHVVLAGFESRNQLYVALTRGARANHVYVPTTIDGSEASFWTEPAMFPRTATEVLQRILARDATQKSAHTDLRDALNPHNRLGRAIDTYLDALGVAAEHTLGTNGLTTLDTLAEQLRPGLLDAPAYPVLRQYLALIALSGDDPHQALAAAIAARELDTADDPAAVLVWRLGTSHASSTEPGPLPWLRGLPRRLPDTLVTEHLRARARLVTALADQIRADIQSWTPSTAPAWARPLLGGRRLLADLAIWRAGNHTPDTDIRPTGPPGLTVGEREHQLLLDARTTDTLGDPHTTLNTWSPLIKQLDARILDDPWWPQLADKLHTAALAGLGIDTRLTRAAAQRPLPDDMPAAALWFRLGLDPSALTPPTGARNLQPEWTTHLHQLLGDHTAEHVLIDPAWTRIVAAVDHGIVRGWTAEDLLTAAHELLIGAHTEDTSGTRPDQFATALAWRIEALLHPDIPESRHQPTHTEAEKSHPITTPDTSMSESPDNPAPTTTDPAELSRVGIEPRTNSGAGDGVPEGLRAVAEMFRTGRIQDATTALGALTREATDEQIQTLDLIATTLYRNSFPVAKARLRWAAERFPQLRALIEAATPAADPHTYRPDAATIPTNRDELRHHAARDDKTRLDPQLRRPSSNLAGSDAARAAQEYLDVRADVDDAPHHMPVPEGIPHPYFRGITQSSKPVGYALDYDLAAVPDSRGFCCVNCSIERAVTDTIPTGRRQSDDGLCQDCRDNNIDGIPDHNPVDHLRARCAHITDAYPASAALTMLRRDWSNARTQHARDAIEAWVEQDPNLQTRTRPSGIDSSSTAANLGTPDPLKALTDEQIIQRLAHVERRITLTDNEAILYGPAPNTSDATDPTATTDNQWLLDELTELHAEQHRRAQLTPAQAAAERALRGNHTDESAAGIPALDANAAADVSPQRIDTTTER
ncbi:MobF family relaxase [Nocardia sp. NPDC004123]